MAKRKEIVGFELSLSGRDDGTLEAAYIRFKSGRVAKTREIREDTLLADYDHSGDLVGIEILSPVKLSDLTDVVEAPRRSFFRKFVKHAVPQQFVTA